MRKAFVFTIDAMYSLAALSLLALAYMVLSNAHFETQKYGAMESQARDFLRVNFKDDIILHSDDFRSYTGHNLTAMIGDYYFPFNTPQDVAEFVPLSGNWQWDPKEGGAGNWGYMNITNTSATPAYYRSILRGFEGDDYWVEAKFSPLATSIFNFPGGSMIFGLSGRANSAGGRYACVLQNIWAAGVNASIIRLDDWASSMDRGAPNTLVSSPPFGYHHADTSYYFRYHINLSFSGNLINCTIFKYSSSTYEVSISAIDSTYSSGFFALETSFVGGHNTTFIDDVGVHGVFKSIPDRFRSVLYKYPAPCRCKDNCGVNRLDYCLKNQDSLNYSMKEAWIS
ncbi:MAG: hypothetical protein ABIG96_04865 [Candidatus Micrarchaeota archaeon]